MPSLLGWDERGTIGRALQIAASLLLLLVWLGGCSIQLSPPYDASQYKSLTDLNVKTETLFASLSKGGTKKNFPDYKPIYDQLIGGFSAARLAAVSRDVPALSRRILSAPALNAVCGSDPTDCVNPTPHHLDKVIVLLTTMRDYHQAGTLPGELVSGFNNTQGGFKTQYELEMNPVLVFEAALQR